MLVFLNDHTYAVNVSGHVDNLVHARKIRDTFDDIFPGVMKNPVVQALPTGDVRLTFRALMPAALADAFDAIGYDVLDMVQDLD